MQMTVMENAALSPSVCRITLGGDTRAVTRPGQFAQVSVPGFYLRRPLSVCDWESAESGWLTLVYKVVGHGTEALTGIPAGETLDVLVGLGNGFTFTLGRSPLLLGGGVGTPPLYGLAKRLLAAGQAPMAVLGFNCEGDIILQKEFEALGIPTLVATADGSACVRGFATDAAETFGGKFDCVYACGPLPMLEAANAFCQKHHAPAEFSFESRMACGFGACMGCTMETKTGPKRVCKDGPVFDREAMLWRTRA